MNKTQNKLNEYIKSIDKDIDRIETSNKFVPSNISLTIATVLRDVKEDLIVILEDK